MKIVFMGTPDFAVASLEALLEAGHQIAAVVTQPDKPKGRGKEMQYSAVKTCAMKHGLFIFQPAKVKEKEVVETLRALEADIFVVAAFGQILSREILELPRFGCVNIHASLLPRYRGAAPIQWAVINGEAESGITIMQMDVGLDTGDMLLQKKVPISEDETGESLHDKLREAGARAIVEALPLLEQGLLTAVPQTDDNTCYAKMLHKAMGRIDWNLPAKEIERLVRGLHTWPSAYTYYRGKLLKIGEAKVSDKAASEAPGSVCEVGRDFFAVSTGEKQLVILKVQLEGKKQMSVGSFLLGNRIEQGFRFDNEEDRR